MCILVYLDANNISDKSRTGPGSRTDMVYLWCESYSEYLDDCAVKNISDKQHTDMASL